MVTADMKMRVAWFTLGLLAACASPQPYGVDSPYFRFPPGTRLVIERDIRIPPDSARAHFQYGKVVARSEIFDMDPYCILQIATVADTAQTVRAGTFEVTGVNRWFSDIEAGIDPLQGRQVASFSRSGPTQWFYKTEFSLRSETQPGVRSLTCQSDQNLPGVAPFMRHLTLAEMRAALGTLAALRVPNETP